MRVSDFGKKRCSKYASGTIIGFSSINHPFWGTPISGNTHVAPENRPLEKGDLFWKPMIFRCEMLVSGRVSSC